MPYNRRDATPMAGAPWRFGGAAQAPFGKTPCWQQGRWCETAFVSLRGGGRCQGEHERLRLCSSHDEEQPGGPWESCQPCRAVWSPRDDKRYAEHPINWPRY